VIVVVGMPAWRPAADEPGMGSAAGRAVEVARAAVASGAQVELVGKVGDDRDGDRLLIDLASIGVGHVAVLRAPGASTLTLPAVRALDAPAQPALEDDVSMLVTTVVDAEGVDPSDGRTGWPPTAAANLSFEPADLELALRYLVDFRVVVLADALAPPVVPVVADAAAFADARIVAVVTPGSVPELPEQSTILEPPASDPAGEFARLVGTYAAALDRGEPPEDAFRSATMERGWEPSGEPG
jgi:hypothetical protein